MGGPNADPIMRPICGIPQRRPFFFPSREELYLIPTVHVPLAPVTIPPGLQQLAR